MEQKHFTAIVVGKNHEEIMKKFDKNIEVEPYVEFYFSKAKEYYDNEIKVYQEFLKEKNHDEGIVNLIRSHLDLLEQTDYIDHYLNVCEQFGCKIDKETGNAISTKNPIGYYDHCRLGKDLSLPLITKNGEEVFSARKGDIDFSKMHQYNTIPYVVAWETVVDGREPKNDEERRIYDNMKNRTAYFDNFPNKETYVAWSTSFWGYAFIDENGWKDVDTTKIDQITWVNEFYDKYIKNLSDDEVITVYECVRY